MNKARLIRLVLVVAVLVLAAAPLYAPFTEKSFLYYSDSGYTIQVGEEDRPGPNCPNDEYNAWGDLTAPYRKIIVYDGCNYAQPSEIQCSYHDETGWHIVSCP